MSYRGFLNPDALQYLVASLSRRVQLWRVKTSVTSQVIAQSYFIRSTLNTSLLSFSLRSKLLRKPREISTWLFSSALLNCATPLSEPNCRHTCPSSRVTTNLLLREKLKFTTFARNGALRVGPESRSTMGGSCWPCVSDVCPLPNSGQ